MRLEFPFMKMLTMLALGVSSWVGLSPYAIAQRAQFSDFYEVQPSQPATIQGGALVAPGLNQGVPPITTQPPAPVFQQPSIVTGPVFDPYNSASSPLPTLPGSGVSPNSSNTYSNYNYFNPPPTQSFGGGSPTNLGGDYVIGNQPVQPWTGGWSNSAPFSNNSTAWPSQTWSQLRNQWLPRLIEHPRFRHTWISGNNGNELGVNETEVATTLTYANFLGSGQPLLTTPGFIVDFWSGPDTALTGFDLPAITYAPYLSFEASSDLKKNAGLETSVQLGVFTDFRNVNSDSLRIMGTGLIWLDVNPYTRFKGGVEYLDRINVKMLPAFGFFMQPNSDLKIDLYFPRPRFSHRLPKRGNLDAWVYAGADYGG
jgi:hypothetical protein